MAAVHHFKLRRAMLLGFRRQLQKDGVCKDGFIGMLEAGLERESLTIRLIEEARQNGQASNHGTLGGCEQGR